MAIYHYHREIGKRGQGKNAVFAVAYIRGEKRTCHKTDETKDFTTKHNVIYKKCFLPNDAPEWTKQLCNAKIKDEQGKYVVDESARQFSEHAWNQIEIMEKRRDAQLYFHDDIAIPNELSKKAAIELIDNFVRENIAKDGIFCDVAIHWEEGNHHAHIIRPLRKMIETGFDKKLRFTKADLTKEVNYIRGEWADKCNQKLKEYGHTTRVDHRSYDERGINLKPTKKVGKATHMGGYEHQKLRIADNQRIRAENLKIIQKNPEVIATKMTQEHTEFTDLDVKDEINKYVINEAILSDLNKEEDLSNEKAAAIIIQHLEKEKAIFSEKELKADVLKHANNKEEFDKILSAVSNSDKLINLGLGYDGRTHYTTKKNFEIENDIGIFAEQISSRSTFFVKNELIKEVSKKYNLNKGQTRALKYITQGQDLALVKGYAGTGKTYMLQAAREVWEKSGFKVYGLALSGSAAASLEAESKIKSRTIHRFLKAVNNGYINLGDKSIIVMDEMGMTASDDMRDVLKITNAISGKFVSAGDIEQTQSVGRGAAARAMMEQCGTVVLDEVIRQQKEWQRKATINFETYKTSDGLDAYFEHKCIHFAESSEKAKVKLIDDWFRSIEHNIKNTKDKIITAYKNETVIELNKMARDKLLEAKLLELGKTYQINNTTLELFIGDRVLFGRNDYKIGVKNGNFGTVVDYDDDCAVTVELDNGKTITFDIEEYKDIQHGYAATVHKLQGVTYNDCFEYIDGRGWDRHLMLVGSTRHRHNLNIYADHSTFTNFDDLKHVVCRQGLKDHVFDYPVGFSLRRGFNSERVINKAVRFIRKTANVAYDGWLYLTNYQEYLLKQAKSSTLRLTADEQKRKDAIIVADFCDNRLSVAEKLQKLESIKELDTTTLQKEIYELQVTNSKLAKTILNDFDKYKLALDKNRLDKSAIEKSIIFGEKDAVIKNVIDKYHLKQLGDRVAADKIYSDIKNYYGHIIANLENKDRRNEFIGELRHLAMNNRYDLAFDKWSKDYRHALKAIKQYVDLNYEISKALKQLDEIKASEVTKPKENKKYVKIQERLNMMSKSRDKLAFEINTYKDERLKIRDFFDVDKELLAKHVERYHDRQLVKKFSELSESKHDANNYQKQVLAHKIKMDPKRYGGYIDGTLEDGWKQINLENWRYDRNLTIGKSSAEFRANLRTVNHYYEACYMARDAWQAAIKRRQSQSYQYFDFVHKAQGLSHHRDKIASLLINNLEKYSGAIGFNKVDLSSLSERARRYDYLQRYVKTTNEALKMHMAHHINDNLKHYGAGVATLGIFKEIKNYNRHYEYLQLIKQSPDQAVRAAIRLAENYNQKRIKAGIAWSQVKTLEKLGKDNTAAIKIAKHLTYQRNKAAYDFVYGCAEHGFIEPEIKGVKIDYERLNKACDQHLAYRKVISYLNANNEDKGKLAHELLLDKTSYHFVYDKKIDFKELRIEAKNWLYNNDQNIKQSKQNKIRRTITISRWDYETISQALMANPEDTYTAIFGDPKKRTAKELRYDGGLIVTLRGSNEGKWYSFTDGTGGGPIQAIQLQNRLSLKDALEYGASLAGLGKDQATITEQIAIAKDAAAEKAKNREKFEAIEKAHRIESAKSIWNGTKAVSNSLAERYFVEHRHITNLDKMEVRYWPRGSKWVDYDETGKQIQKINKIPAAVIAAKDHTSEIIGVQRIYLDQKTASKNTFMSDPKLSKGITKGAAGVIQVGDKDGRLYLAEGPETGASIALADKKATVLTSFSVSNLGNLADVIKSYEPSEIILAADNDGKHSKTKATTEKALQKLSDSGLNIRVIYPKEIKGKEKVDWNDVLIHEGIESLKSQLEIKPGGKSKMINNNGLYYDLAEPIEYTPAEKYLREEKGLIGVDLSEIRYHSAIKLPDSDKTAHAIIMPAINQAGKVQAEQILYLDTKGGNIIKTATRGSSDGCVIIAQKTSDSNTIYFADNIVDAKSIAVGDKKANIFVSLKNYQDLDKLAWTVDQLKHTPDVINVTVENFTKTTKKTLSNLTKPLTDKGHTVLLAKGQLPTQDYTHISINDALLHQKKVINDNFIEKKPLQPEKQPKISLKERLAKTLKAPKAEKIEIKKPQSSKSEYYVKLSDDKIQKLKEYFAAVDKLTKENSFKNTLAVAQKANEVYNALSADLIKLNKHPQPINDIKAKTPAEAPYKRLEQKESISLIDLSAILKKVAIPRVDTQTRKELNQLAKLMTDHDKDNEFKKAATKFVKDKAKLIKLWKQSENMPDSAHSFVAKDAERLEEKKELDRTTLLGIIKISTEFADTKQSQALSKKLSQEDRSRGGRSK